VLEALLPIHRELSVVVARGADGEHGHLPVQQNLHRDGILATQVPAPDVELQADRSSAWPHGPGRVDAYVGVLCVEFFVLTDGRVLANEMAPRPHNSGHPSIDACDRTRSSSCSCAPWRLPLPQPRQHSPGGDVEPAGRPVVRRAPTRRRVSPTGRGAGACPACTCTCTARAEPRARPQDGPSDGDRGHGRGTRAGGRPGQPPSEDPPHDDAPSTVWFEGRQAADVLAAGGLVAFATETVYGLGARADDDAAVADLRRQGAAPDHPLIVHVATRRCAGTSATSGPGRAALAERFWPGPLTLIVPRQPGVGTARGRWAGQHRPAHARRTRSFMALLLAAAARGVRGVAAPSANRFGRVSPTRASCEPMSSAPDLRCWTAATARWASSRPSSTARASTRHCCAPACSTHRHRGRAGQPLQAARRPGAAGLGHAGGALRAAMPGCG
jgi:tRNA A37 threonylcarbamoyladenosine synthetase subunit TsaC/SUA5/YrdC